jgi:hypothetical protein
LLEDLMVAHGYHLFSYGQIHGAGSFLHIAKHFAGFDFCAQRL